MEWPGLLNANAIEVKRAELDAASADAGGNELVEAVEDKKICVLGLFIMAADDVDARLYSGPADTGAPITGPLPVGVKGGAVVGGVAHPEAHWIQTAAGEALTLKLSAAIQCGGCIVYYEG